MTGTAGWEPHTLTTTEVVEPGPVRALGALLDGPLPVPDVGDPLPALWHWVALPRWAAATTLGRDGHPARGTFLPPIDLPRRMFAGGEVTVHRPLEVGEEIRRESRVGSVEEKNGRSGRLAVVVVETRLSGRDGRLRVEERQDLVFREAPGPAADPPPPEPAAALDPAGAPLRRDGAAEWSLATDPTLLMRFSAATANAHRIHYDWPYATRVEGYPGLVVHGPLMTILLAETLREAGALPDQVRLRHRNRAPLFCGQPATVRHRPDGDGVAATLDRGPADEPVTCTSLTASPLEKGTPHA
ncbi:FAS1-like dehydratase domain-containing protein [Blastococcus sp. SYSU DS0539]